MFGRQLDYEGRLERFYKRLLRPGDVCVDVGAHKGRHTLPMVKRIGHSGHVYAFEPLPSVRAELSALLEREGVADIVTLSGTAVSDYTGTSTFVVAEDTLEESGLRERVYNVPTRTTTIDVDVATLDESLPSDLAALRFIKIDCEGAEWSVLRGAAATIARLRPVVSFEFGEAAYGAYGTDPVEVHRFFTAHGYEVVDILGQVLDESRFSESSVRQSLWDYVAAPSDHSAFARRVLQGGLLGRVAGQWA